MKSSFAERLKELRLKRGWTQKELAEALGVARASISHWETGRVPPSLHMLCEVRAALEVSWDELLGKP